MSPQQSRDGKVTGMRAGLVTQHFVARACATSYVLTSRPSYLPASYPPRLGLRYWRYMLPLARPVISGGGERRAW